MGIIVADGVLRTAWILILNYAIITSPWPWVVADFYHYVILSMQMIFGVSNALPYYTTFFSKFGIWLSNFTAYNNGYEKIRDPYLSLKTPR